MDCSILSIVDPENREVNIDMGFWKEVHVLGMWDVLLHPYHQICVESKPKMLIVDRQIHLMLNTLGNPTYIIESYLPMLFL